jgi:hypothetical protein
MKLTSSGAVAVFLLVLVLSPLVDAQADSFDVPLKRKVVLYEVSPYYPGGNVRIKLSCFSYANFMVKQYDEGQKGAEWLAIVPTEKDAAPPCTRSHAVGEKIIKYLEWVGYFKGAKRNLVFFDATDGTDGGMPFVVYDSKTGKQVFKDSYYESSMWNAKVEESPFNQMRISNSPDGQISLTYLRVTATDCDLHRAKALCWERVRNKLAVMSTEAPVCSGYKDVTTRWSSSLAYPIEILLFPQPSAKNVVGPVKCWPVD